MNKAPAVLFVTTSFPRFPGDFAGSFIYRFARYLVEDGVPVTVLAPAAAAYPIQETMSGIYVRRFTYFWPPQRQRLAYDGGGILANMRLSWLARLQVPLFFLALLWRLWREQDQHQIIHCHWLPTAAAALLTRPFSRTKPPIVFTNWGSDTRLMPTWLTRWVVQRVEGCISTAVETDEHLRQAGRDDFRRIMAPVEEERFNREVVAPDLAQELGLTPDVPVIAFVGRLNYFKDPLTFIRACGRVQEQGVPFIALVAGDGDLQAECQAEVTRLGLADTVRFLGMRSDPERVLRLAAATVHISPIENTWANAIAEAMFMSVPVVLTRVGYTERLFTHERDCLLIPPQDPDVLASALIRLLTDAGLGQHLATGAWNLLREQKKEKRAIVTAVRAYYDELLRE